MTNRSRFAGIDMANDNNVNMWFEFAHYYWLLDKLYYKWNDYIRLFYMIGTYTTLCLDDEM